MQLEPSLWRSLSLKGRVSQGGQWVLNVLKNVPVPSELDFDMFHRQVQVLTVLGYFSA